MADPVWHGVRLRTLAASADPDVPPRTMTILAAWPDAAASGLAALCPGTGPVRLPEAAAAWVAPATVGDAALAARLHRLLLARRAAPDAATWRGTSSNCPGFTLNLPAFADPEGGFDAAGFAAAVADATTALMRLNPRAPRLAVGFADLFGLFAGLGLDPSTPDAVATAQALACLLRSVADTVSACGRAGPAVARAQPPDATPVPGLAAASRAAWDAAWGLRPTHSATTAITIPGPECALLGVEAGGIAPPHGPLDAEGCLSLAARARLAAQRLSPEQALAALYAGTDPLPAPSPATVDAIEAAVAPFVHALPPRHAGVLGFAPRPSRARVARLPLELPEPAARRRGLRLVS